MKIIILKWNAYGMPDIIDGFSSLGHEVIPIDFNKENVRSDPKFETELEDVITRTGPDLVFSLNYFPVCALVCKKTGTNYASWIYDNPYVLLYSYTIVFPTNYIFVFDKTQYENFHQNGINTIYYLPLCSNAHRLSKYNDNTRFASSKMCNNTSIAFVGSLYTEEHQFYNRIKNISDYSKGFLEGLMESQSHIYGYNFIEETLPKNIIKEMQKDLPLTPNEDGVETEEWLFAQYVLNRRITSIERTRMLKLIGTRYEYDLYTKNADLKLPGCHNHGPISEYDGAPYVYKNVKINLNFTLRSITSGIPLRAFEIIGSGGFLLTNYQSDFDDCFTANEDYVYYESPDNMMEKIEYYLGHEKERAEIARNGFEKAIRKHTYEKRLSSILNKARSDNR